MKQATVRVRYAETDKMGVVYYANYLVWFEVGRVEYLRALDFDYRQMEIADDCCLPVVEVTCRYKAPARYDDQLIIETSVVALRSSVMKFAYRVVRSGDQKLLAEGETTHVICDHAMRKKTLPEKYEAVIRSSMTSA